MRVLDLFSAAAGGWTLGMHRAGFQTVAACEAVEWRRILYAENNPGIPIYDDVRTLSAGRLVSDLGYLPDIIVGSPPCQDISSANTKGKGVEGERSGLFFEAVRLIGECRPRWFALENSANLRTRGADAVLAALEAIGYACWPLVVRAGDSPKSRAAGIGANHERPRCWLIGCDVKQVADADGHGRDARWSGRGIGGDVSVSADSRHADEQPCASRVGVALGEGGGDISGGCLRPDAKRGGNRPLHAADAHENEIRQPVLPGRPEPQAAFAGQPDQPEFETANTTQERRQPRAGNDEGSGRKEDGREPSDCPACRHGIRWPWACHECDDEAWRTRNAPHPDQAGQADGRMESGLRQEEIADDGCGDGRSADGQGVGQMAVRPPDSGDPDGAWPLWSLDDLAHSLRVDDGLSERLAQTRVAVGGPKGTSAASLIVEAYGDAVVPQIPEAIGRAILRVEAAMAAVRLPHAA